MIVVGYDGSGQPVRAPGSEHALIIGPPGSGKTQGFLVPSLVGHSGPAVVTSSKTDVAAFSIENRARLGHVWCFTPGTAPIAGTTQVVWDPVRRCEDFDEALLRSDAMVRTVQALAGSGGDDAFWYAMAARMLASLLHAVALGRREGQALGMTDLLAWVSAGELESPLAILQRSSAVSALAVVAGVGVADSRLRDSVLMTVVQAVRAFDSPRLQAAMDSAPAFDPEEFSRGRNTLYVVAPLEHQELFATLVVGLIDEVSRAAMAFSATQEHLPREQRRSMLMALDEVANIAPLPNLPRLVSAGGGQGCQVLAVLQDLSQAKQRWRDASEGFLTMFHHKILLPGILHHPTLEAFERGLPHTAGAIGGGATAEWPAHRIAGLRPGRALRVSGTLPTETAVLYPMLPRARD